MTKHTQTPWAVDNQQPIAGINFGDDPLKSIVKGMGDATYVIAEMLAPDDAEFIVRACNAHDDLVAALDGLLADKYLSDPINNDRMAQARAALTKAKEV